MKLMRVLSSFISITACVTSPNSDASPAIEVLHCRYIVSDFQGFIVLLKRDMQPQPQLIFEKNIERIFLAELVDVSDRSASFDYLDLTADNIRVMSDFFKDGDRSYFFLELPNACVDRSIREGGGGNLTKLDLCYHAAQRFFLRLSLSDSSELFPVEQEIFEGTNYKDDSEGGGYKENYRQSVIEDVNRELETVFNETGKVFDLSVVEFTHWAEIPTSYYFDRTILLDENYIVSRLRFHYGGTSIKFHEFTNVFHRDSGLPVCADEFEARDLNSEFERFVFYKLPLRTD